jgi:hypothetical protein
MPVQSLWQVCNCACIGLAGPLLDYPLLASAFPAKTGLNLKDKKTARKTRQVPEYLQLTKKYDEQQRHELA